MLLLGKKTLEGPAEQVRQPAAERDVEKRSPDHIVRYVQVDADERKRQREIGEAPENGDE
ncbi:hypothetical protein D3C87_1736200 [compost metagenome]